MESVLGDAVHRREDAAPPDQFGTALTVFIVNAMGAYTMCLLRQPMLDGFARGFMDGFSPLIKKMVGDH